MIKNAMFKGTSTEFNFQGHLCTAVRFGNFFNKHLISYMRQDYVRLVLK